ncbi:MAG: CPBP family intramembrane metalloprotease [Bacilli bacterium]|nr:CPBP family intramembrane metalloprotease [Bacilli bacterium]
MNFDGFNFLVTLIFTLLPVCILKWKDLITSDKKMNILVTLSVMFISSLCSYYFIGYSKNSISLFTIGATSLFGSIINYYILSEKILVKKLPFSLGLILLFILSDLFQLIPISLFDIDIKKMSHNMELYLTIFNNFILMLILLFIFRKRIISDFKDFKDSFNKNIEIGFKYWFIGMALMVGSNLIIMLLTPSKVSNNEEAVRSLIEASPYLSLILTAIFAPILEELVFRVGLKESFKSKYLFCIASGLIFGLLHVVFSYTTLTDFLYVVPYGSLGFVFAMMLYDTKNIYTSMAMHMAHNSFFTIVQILSLTVVF